MLTSARLVFRGAADVDYMKDSVMPCVLWAITKSDEDALDRYEGVAAALHEVGRHRVEVQRRTAEGADLT